jgi:hypothetical protein
MQTLCGVLFSSNVMQVFPDWQASALAPFEKTLPPAVVHSSSVNLLIPFVGALVGRVAPPFGCACTAEGPLCNVPGLAPPGPICCDCASTGWARQKSKETANKNRLRMITAKHTAASISETRILPPPSITVGTNLCRLLIGFRYANEMLYVVLVLRGAGCSRCARLRKGSRLVNCAASRSAFLLGQLADSFRRDFGWSCSATVWLRLYCRRPALQCPRLSAARAHLLRLR